MADTRFDDFVRREQSATGIPDEKPVDWNAEKNEWLRRLDDLFTQVGGFLDSYVKANQVTIQYRQIELNEEYLGSYSTREMIIKIGRKTVTLEPVGTVIIGSKGRVDVVGPLARAQLLLINSEVRLTSQLVHVSVSINGGPLSPPPPRVPKQINWVWKILTRPPKREFVTVDKENFLSLLTEVANG